MRKIGIIAIIIASIAIYLPTFLMIKYCQIVDIVRQSFGWGSSCF